jgi:disease resistance protein RPS2
VVPEDVHDVYFDFCNNLRCLCNAPSLNHATELKHIYLYGCKGIEHILCCSSSSSSSCTLPLQTPEILHIRFLDNLCVLFRKEKDASAQVPPHTFSCLKIIHIFGCPKLKKLLSPGLLLHLLNLEYIYVSDCVQLEEIIEEEEKEEEGMDTTKITLPRLKKLSLLSLPELKSICSRSEVIVCDSLELIFIYDCLNLKRLPLSLPLLNGQPSPSPSLKHITAKEEWWESLEWDCQDTKNVLQPFGNFSLKT